MGTMLRQVTIRRTTQHWRPAFASTAFRAGSLYRPASSARGRDALLGTDKARAGDGGYGDGAYLVNQNDSRSSKKNTQSERDQLRQADSGPQGGRANDDVALTGIDDYDLLGVDFAESEAPE